MFEEEGDNEGETEKNLKIHFFFFWEGEGGWNISNKSQNFNYRLILDIVESN